MKLYVDELAIFGNDPVFEKPLHVGRPNIGSRSLFLNRLEDALDRRWLTNGGPFVQEFEQRIAEIVGVKHCIAVCNGTMALEIAIRASGLSGEVIVPAFTFVATAHALQWQAITPVFCDIDPQTHTIDPARVERLITPKTSAIIGVHLWGRPCDVDALAEIAARHNLKLLYDACHAFGVSYRGQMIGRFGNAEVFSFHATKFVNALEGGAIVTDDDELAKKIRLMKNFGFADYDTVTYIGTNGKMNEISAAMGLTSLESIERFVSINYRNYRTYLVILGQLPGIKMVTFDESQKCNYQYIVMEIDETVTGLGRDQLLKILHAENILARRYFYPGCHHMEPYRSYLSQTELPLPVTEKLSQRVLCLPTGTTVSDYDIGRICQIIRLAITHSDKINEYEINYSEKQAYQL